MYGKCYVEELWLRNTIAQVHEFHYSFELLVFAIKVEASNHSPFPNPTSIK
jgi:hypothetical protein